jgi:hypothetical protein
MNQSGLKFIIQSKVFPELFYNWAPRHEGVLGSGGIAPRINNLGTRWRWVVSFTPRPLYPQGKSPRYPLQRRLGGPQSRSGRGGEEKNSQPPTELEPQNIDVQPVAQGSQNLLLLLLLIPLLSLRERNKKTICNNNPTACFIWLWNVVIYIWGGGDKFRVFENKVVRKIFRHKKKR